MGSSSFVKGKIPEPPSNAPAATKNKYTKGEVKAKKIIRDSIDKHLVAYLKVTSMERSDLTVEGRADALLAISLDTMQGSVQIEGTHHMMIITIIPGATSIEGMTGTMAMEKGMQDIKEMVDPARNQGTLAMMNPMLLTIRKKSIILYPPSPLPLL